MSARLPAAALVAAALLLASCTAVAPPAQEPSSPSPVSPASPAQPTRPPTGTPPLSTVPFEPTPPGVIGEVPQEIMDALIEEAAALAGAAVPDVEVLRAEQVTWSDGSLGCPQPGMVYTQALVDGYWVVLEVGGETYDFRMSDTGVPQLCEQARPSSDDRAPDY